MKREEERTGASRIEARAKLRIEMEVASRSRVRSVQDSNFRQLVLDRSGAQPVCVEFWARNRERMVFADPVAEQVAEVLDGKAVMAEMNIEDNPVVSGTYEIRSTPTVLVFKKGRVVDRVVGRVPPRAIADRVQAWVDGSTNAEIPGSQLGAL